MRKLLERQRAAQREERSLLRTAVTLLGNFVSWCH